MAGSSEPAFSFEYKKGAIAPWMITHLFCNSPLFFCVIFPNTKIPGRTTWNLCVEMYITTKGIEKSKTKKKTVPGFGAISIDNFSF